MKKIPGIYSVDPALEHNRLLAELVRQVAGVHHEDLSALREQEEMFLNEHNENVRLHTEVETLRAENRILIESETEQMKANQLLADQLLKTTQQQDIAVTTLYNIKNDKWACSTPMKYSDLTVGELVNNAIDYINKELA